MITNGSVFSTSFYFFMIQLPIMTNTIVKRVQRRTPVFFKKLRNISLLLTGISASVLAAPVALPAILIKIAGYLAVAGAVAGSVSQTAVTNERK